MKLRRKRIVLGPVLVFVTAALLLLPVWAEMDHGTAPMIAAWLFFTLASVCVPGRFIPIRHRHQKPRGRGPA